jgi:hypothetical protein
MVRHLVSFLLSIQQVILWGTNSQHCNSNVVYFLWSKLKRFNLKNVLNFQSIYDKNKQMYQKLPCNVEKSHTWIVSFWKRKLFFPSLATLDMFMYFRKVLCRPHFVRLAIILYCKWSRLYYTWLWGSRGVCTFLQIENSRYTGPS